MRNACLLFILTAGSHAGWAQEAPAPASRPTRIGSVGLPVGKPTNVRLQYERVLGPRASVGARAAWYFGSD